MANPGPEFVPLRQVGDAWFGVSRERIRQMIHRGQLPSVQINRKLYVPRRYLEGLADDAIAKVANAGADR